MKLSAIAMASLIAAGVASSHADNSSTHAIGNLAPRSSMVSKKTLGSGELQDSFTFSAESHSQSVYRIIDFSFLGNRPLISTSIDSITLYKGSGLSGFIGETPIASTPSLNNIVGWSPGPIDAGSSFIQIAGSTTGSVRHGSQEASSVSPATEPPSYAVLLAALGLMGSIVIRRRNSRSG